MKFFRKTACLLLAVIICLSFVSCNSENNVYLTNDYYTKDGELTISPYFAYYNNGKVVAELEEIDPEMADEGPLDDGSFNIYFMVCNNSPYDRKITEITVDFIRNKDNYDIVEGTEFSMDDETYIASGEKLIIPCVFEADFVNLEAKLKGLSAKATIAYEGCVVNGAEPEKVADSLTSSVKELTFTDADGIEGSFTIQNNFNTDKTIGTVSFMIYTNSGAKITKEPVTMNVDTTLGAGEQITLKYAVLPGNVADSIKETKLFDSVEIKLTEE